MSENQYPPTKPVCQLDADNLYLHQTVADLDPMATDGGYLLPAGCVDTRPPETRAGFAARWQPEKKRLAIPARPSRQNRLPHRRRRGSAG